MSHSLFSQTYPDLIQAYENGSLSEWVQAYLKREGSHELAAELKKHNADYIELLEVPLSFLKKIEGPEPPEDREPLPVWDTKVSQFEKALADGFVSPPIIVTDFWKPFEIADGNHRHEALLKNGIEKYWTIFFIKNEENKRIVDQYKRI